MIAATQTTSAFNELNSYIIDSFKDLSLSFNSLRDYAAGASFGDTKQLFSPPCPTEKAFDGTEIQVLGLLHRTMVDSSQTFVAVLRKADEKIIFIPTKDLANLREKYKFKVLTAPKIPMPAGT